MPSSSEDWGCKRKLKLTAHLWFKIVSCVTLHKDKGRNPTYCANKIKFWVFYIHLKIPRHLFSLLMRFAHTHTLLALHKITYHIWSLTQTQTQHSVQISTKKIYRYLGNLWLTTNILRVDAWIYLWKYLAMLGYQIHSWSWWPKKAP